MKPLPFALLLLLLLLAACQPGPGPTPTGRPPRTPFPLFVVTPGTPPSPPAGETDTPDPYPQATADTQPFQQEEPEVITIAGPDGIIFPIVWHTTQPRPLGKRGLAWHTTVCGDATELGVAWYMNWDSRRNSCPPSQQPEAYYPMWRPNRVWEWNQWVDMDYDGIALFLNEPERPDQDNLTPTAAAHLYRTFITFICPGCKAIVLNLSYANTSYLIEWREAYRAAYGEYPAVYAYGVHSYGAEHEIIEQVGVYRAALVAIGEEDKPVVLSEFGGCWQGEQPFAHQLTPAEMGRVIAQLEAWPWLAGYAFFGVRWYKPGDEPPEGLHCDALFTPDGMTELGQEYAALPPSGRPEPGEGYP